MSWTSEIESTVSADRMFKAAILDWHNLGPEILPEVLESGTSEGTIRQLNFTPGMPFSYVKERMDFVDHDGFECESTITEGGHLGTRLESASVKYKIVEAEDGGEGCVVKVETRAKLLPGLEADEGKATEKIKEGVVKHFKLVEAYLLANPDKYYVPPTEKPVPVSTSDEDVPVGGDSHPRLFPGDGGCMRGPGRPTGGGRWNPRWPRVDERRHMGF